MESKIEWRNYLALKLQSYTTQSRLIGVEENLEARVKAEVDPLVIFKTAHTVVKATTKAIVLPLERNVVNVAKTIISKLSVNPQKKEIMISANIDPKERGKRGFTK